MPNDFVTLLDLTALNAPVNDPAVGIVEVVRDFSPEVQSLAGRPIQTTHSYVTRRKALPGGKPFGGSLFRNVGEGVATEAGKYERILQETYFVDGQLEVDDALVQADPQKQGSILAMESEGQIKAKFLGLGRQFYYGRSRDDKGFYGLQALVDDEMVDGSGGATSNCESVYLIRNNLDGVHFLYGMGKGLTAGSWNKQQVRDASNGRYMAWVNNFSGYIGLGMNHPLSIYRIANLNDSGTAGTFITDKMIAKAISKFPIGYPPTHICMSRRQRYWLQASRTVISQSNLTNAASIPFPMLPTESNGVPILCTDALALTEDKVS